VQALPLGSLHFAQGGGGMGGGIALPHAKVKNRLKTQKSQNCTEFALSAYTKNECQKKKFRMSIDRGVNQYCFQYWVQYWSSTGVNMCQHWISSAAVVHQSLQYRPQYKNQSLQYRPQYTKTILAVQAPVHKNQSLQDRPQYQKQSLQYRPQYKTTVLAALAPVHKNQSLVCVGIDIDVGVDTFALLY